MRSAPQTCGPYGRIDPDGVRRLTDDGRRWLAEWLDTHPRPMAMAWRYCRRRVKAALRQGATAGCVESVVNAATVKAATIYEPLAGCQFSSLLVRVVGADLRTYARDLARRNDAAHLLTDWHDERHEPTDHRRPPVDVDTADLLSAVRSAVAGCGLPELDRRIVHARLGLDDGEPVRLRVVADRLAVCRHHCGRVIREAVSVSPALKRILTLAPKV